MAINFKVFCKGKKNNRSVWIQLQGNFDGTSAHELANVLKNYSDSYPSVTIDTDRLKSINTFGLDVFANRLKLMSRSYARIAFTGKYKNNFG